MAKVTEFGKEHVELRIKGHGTTGKGDRTELLTAEQAFKLASDLLNKALPLLSRGKK